MRKDILNSDIKKLYIKEQLSVADIINKLGCCMELIYNRLDEMNIKRRNYHTEKTREKISNNHKGMKATEETKNLMKKSHMGLFIGKKHPLYGIRGKENPNWGSHRSKETIEKLRIVASGKYPSNTTRKKMSNSHAGDKHWNWKGGISFLVEKIRGCFEYRQWRSDVFTRDNFTCQDCGQIGGNLEAHHKKSFSSILQYYEITTMEEALTCEELWNINNGVTLCEKCHGITKRKKSKKGLKIK